MALTQDRSLAQPAAERARPLSGEHYSERLWSALGYLVAVTAAEIVTVYLNAGVGIMLHIGLLGLLIFHSSYSTDRLLSRLLLSLTLVPLTRILSLAMPLTTLPQMYWYPLIYAPLVLASVMVMLRLNIRPREVGLRVANVRLQMMVAVTGFGFGILEYLVLRPQPLASSFSFAQVALPALILVVSTGFVEEFVFRGILQGTARGALGRWGITYVSAVFAILHMGHLSLLDLGLVFVIAMFFAWVVRETGSLFGVILAHGIINVLIYLVLPFLF